MLEGEVRAEIESAKSQADFEKAARSHEESSGFMRFLTVNHYEHTATGTVRLAYDLPSSLMSRLHNKDVAATAKELDKKLISLAELVAGTAP